ncbi:cellobiose transport system substrate-binding protein [Saccharothrix tamanrassetensis]|uniref:Cellobiose transport system substrate-binding protein n=1 Tax=Saccharothrix tamanrassetensis TaxID=1051531 RepID=A0A841CI17_9PSEU|nr:extracellular solute-binding protein [Saccharothrix tamanrassetensis]MBB5955838.1 cellobiose transport system substrate-binding protein [Saccharothrix tamanrassetensis]
MSRTSVGRAATTIAIAVAATMTTACGGGGGDAGDGRVRLSVGVFSDFGYDRLLEEYQAAHPGVEVEQRKVKMEQHHTQLATQLAGGRGAADVVAIEEGNIAQFRQSKDRFVNLADYGAKDLASQWAPWKWNQGTTDDGDFVLGLGTDMGSLAICYRRDLFEAAGLPADRDAVGALWPTWADFQATADRFTAATPNVKFVDAAQNVYKAVLDQTEEGYFAKDDSYIADRNPKVADAFGLAASLGEKRQTSALTPFSQDWNVALKQASFATTTCPAWALALIKAGAGDEAAGKWDVATAPGGGGNWGGSFLAVPRQGGHPREAYELAKWLTAPEQQKRIFKETGNLPSEPAAYQDPEVTSTVNEYFNQAPVGRIFGDSAENLKPTYRGSKDSKVTPVFNNALNRVETGKQSTSDSLAQALREARDAVK